MLISKAERTEVIRSTIQYGQNWIPWHKHKCGEVRTINNHFVAFVVMCELGQLKVIEQTGHEERLEKKEARHDGETKTA